MINDALHLVRKVGTALALALVVAHPQALAQDNAKPKGFDAFRLVLSRNVFDPERQAAPSTVQRSVPTGVVQSSVTLTGTMVTPSKSLAFFGSTRSEYNKVAALQDTLGDYKILSIAPNEVTLQHAGQTTVLGVGKQLPLAGTEPAPPGASTAPGATSPPAALPPGAAPATGPTSDKDEILRRMMQRRQQEMSR